MRRRDLEYTIVVDDELLKRFAPLIAEIIPAGTEKTSTISTYIRSNV